MKKLLIHFLSAVLLSVVSVSAFAQVTVKGQVVDADTNEPLIGAAVRVDGGMQGMTTDIDGNFSLNVPKDATIAIQYLGYKDLKVKITRQGQVDLGIIRLAADAFALDDVIITSSIAVARKTPVAMTTLSPAFIEERLGARDFPELLKTTPGVYVIKNGGGFGDSEIMMRGFKTENVAVMVNGVPMNDMEWGGVYWSNWTALSDVTRSKQIQRGLGASKVSSPSVGGSINVVTNSIDSKRGGFVKYGVGANGYNKLLFSVSSGLMENGWAFTLMGGKEWGDGYIQGTEYEGYTYFVNIAKQINDKHQLSFTAFGAPQWHYQRSMYDGLTIKGWQEVKQYMEPDQQYRYNPTYGFGKNGERKTSAKNKYHKPQLSLNHMWQIDTKSSLSTAFYVSIGDGWGYSGQNTSEYSGGWYGSSDGVLSTRFRNADGTFAYDQIQEINEQSGSGSQMVMSVSKNQHKWYGLISTFTREINNNWSYYAGFDGRYYIGTHTNEIIDLYNGKYYIDRNRKNVKAENYAESADPAFAAKKLTVGDVVYRDYDSYILQGGLFSQIEYSNDILSAFVSGAVNTTEQWRYGRFYYDKDHAKSDKVNKFGFTVKSGANYNINENHNVFANIGYISRAPYFSGGVFLQSTTSNATNDDAVNEKTFSFELGYGYQSKYFSANLNAYHTEWKDKTMAKSQDISSISDRIVINMQGVDAIHEGIELEFTAKPLNWLDVKGMFSIGNWRWNNNPSGYWYDGNGQPIKADYSQASGVGADDHAQTILELDGIKVGGSAQTTSSIGVDVRPMKGLRLSADWTFAARTYADWTVSASSMEIGKSMTFTEPWRIPSYSTVDLSGSYSFKIGTLDTTLSGNVNNLLDYDYIQSAYNGKGDWETAYRVFYGFGRTMSLGLKIKF